MFIEAYRLDIVKIQKKFKKFHETRNFQFSQIILQESLKQLQYSTNSPSLTLF